MRRLSLITALLFMSLAGFCQPTPKYQVATILKVEPHPGSGDPQSGAAMFDVSVRVGDIVYVVLYLPPLGELPPTYVAGRQLLVLVGEKTLTYNNMVGESLQVPIEHQSSATGSGR